MNTSDREAFDDLVAKLCAGYGATVTEHRRSAYWSSLAKMSLAQFERCIDQALSEEGPEDLPPPKGIWRIHRGFRAKGPAMQAGPTEDPRDHLLFYANRMFLHHLGTRGGLGSTGRFVPAYGMVDCKPSAELIAARIVVRDLVEWFSAPVLEGDEDATPAEFIRQLMLGLEPVSRIEPRTRAAWEAMRQEPRARIPFPAYMGRELEARYAPNDSLVPA
jgi:hypothetical protein